MLITIDGEGGAGKTTTAEYFSQKLNYFHLDSGAMFRYLAYIINLEKLDPITITPNCLTNIIEKSFSIENNLPVYKRWVNLTYLQNESIGLLAFNLGKLTRIENWYISFQRNLASNMLSRLYNGIIVSGRIGGSRIFPNADKKFYFIADPQIRAKRRFNELINVGIALTNFDSISKSMLERDELNNKRFVSDHKYIDADTIVIDTSNLTLAELFILFEEKIKNNR